LYIGGQGLLGRLIGERNHDRVVIGTGRGRRLRRNPAVNGQALRRSYAGAGNRVSADRVAPIRRPATILVERIIDRCSATGSHFPVRYGRACAVSRVQPNVVSRAVCAGCVNRWDASVLLARVPTVPKFRLLALTLQLDTTVAVTLNVAEALPLFRLSGQV
jgi:regulator of extracellular matrix RemA (YlzA/DUF370 family)